MILRNQLCLPIPKSFIQVSQTRSISRNLLPHKSPKNPQTGNPHRIPKETDGDPKLAGAILEFAQGSYIPFTPLTIGPGAVFVPKDTIGLHLDFAKAQFGGHMGARSALSLKNASDR